MNRSGIDHSSTKDVKIIRSKEARKVAIVSNETNTEKQCTCVYISSPECQNDNVEIARNFVEKTCNLNVWEYWLATFTPISCLACFSNLKMEGTCTSETSVDVQLTTSRYIPEDIFLTTAVKSSNPTINAKDTPHHVLCFMLYRFQFGCDLLHSKTDVPTHLQAVKSTRR
jgi:hypothetical protein